MQEGASGGGAAAVPNQHHSWPCMASLPVMPAPQPAGHPQLQEQPLRELPVNCYPAFAHSDSKLCSRPVMMLADSQTQTNVSELLEHSSAAQDAARLKSELQRQVKDAAAMRRGVVAALQQAQDKAQAQVRLLAELEAQQGCIVSLCTQNHRVGVCMCRHSAVR